jgi:hypothetical protein
MNFPQNQRIGSLAEQDVGRLFTSWGWSVGEDWIDTGYDLNVAPDRACYKGARFLVQVKGTARGKRGAISAPVSKKRLREYLVNPHPVLIVRALGDGNFYWIHAQTWGQANLHRLEGSGVTGVKIEKSNVLADRQLLEAFLDEHLAPASERSGSVSRMAEERSLFLSSIDSRLGVKVSASGNEERYEIFANSDDVESAFQFRPTQDSQTAGRLQDIFGFGLPGTLAVESFRLEGSPLYEAIGASGDHRGELSIRPVKRHIGFVHLYGGATASPFAPSISIPAELFHGTQGVAIESLPESIFDLSVRLSKEAGGGRANVKLGIRDRVHQLPIAHIHELAGVPAWAEKAIDEGMVVECSFENIQDRLFVSPDRLESMTSVIAYARMLARLHLVARAADSSFTLPKDAEISATDCTDINLAYALLKGERRKIGVGPLELELKGPAEQRLRGHFLVTTTMVFSIGARELCALPVRIELPGYHLEEVVDSGRHRLIKGEDGQAWISYASGEAFEGEVRRGRNPS